MKEAEKIPGTIIKRVIRGKTRFYHQWREDGKTKSRYLKAEEVLPLREKLTKQKSGATAPARHIFLTELTAGLKTFTPRKEVAQVLAYLHQPDTTTPFFIVGAARTGKTTLLRQIIAALTETERQKAAFFTCPNEEMLTQADAPLLFVDGLASHTTLTHLKDLHAALGQKVVITLTEAPDAACTALTITHVPESAVLQEAYQDSAHARAFLGDDYAPAYEDTRSLLLDDSKVQPNPAIGSRYAHPLLRRVLGRQLIEDSLSPHLGAAERKAARETLLETLETRILEEEVIRQFQEKHGVAAVHPIRFPGGGHGIVVANEEDLTCELYTVANTDTRHEVLLIDLANPRRLDPIEHRYGLITERIVLYKGRNAHHPTGIRFRNLATL